MVIDVRNKLRGALGSLMDSGATVFGHNNVLSDIDLAVSRGTDRHDAPPEYKYVHEILFLVTNSPGSITFLARRISHRLETARDAIVQLKTLLLLHRLLRGGDRYFEQDLRNLWSSGELRIDLKWSSKDPCLLNIKYSEFLKERMEWFINQWGKLEPIKPLGFQSFEESAMELVLHRLCKCQALLDHVMDCKPSNSWGLSQVAQLAMNITLKESFLVYASFCEWFDIMVNSFPSFKKPMRVLALDVSKKAINQTEELQEYYQSCKSSAMSKNLDYPAIRVITVEEVSAMEHSSYQECDLTVSNADEGRKASQTSLFTSKLETKISTVWVEFDEEDSEAYEMVSEKGSMISVKDMKMKLL